MMKIFIMIFFLLINNSYGQWRTYDVYRCGAKGIAAGGAFTAVADEVSAIYFNPAGLVQLTNFSIFYTMDSQIKLVRIIDPTIKLTYKVPALLGFIYPLKNKQSTVIGFAIDSPFQRKIEDEFAVYKFAPQFSTEITRNFAVGFNIGLAYATYSPANSPYGFGVSYQIGLLYTPAKVFHVGINYQSKIKIYWGDRGAGASDVKETFPDILSIGTATLISSKLIGAFDLEFQNWKSIKFIENGNNTAPVDQIKNGFFKTIHPHLGFIFLEERTGAHMRTGVYTDSFMQYTEGVLKNKTQLLWTIGIGAYALKILKVEASLTDSYLTYFINKNNNKIETIQITAEYRF